MAYIPQAAMGPAARRVALLLVAFPCWPNRAATGSGMTAQDRGQCRTRHSLLSLAQSAAVLLCPHMIASPHAWFLRLPDVACVRACMSVAHNFTTCALSFIVALSALIFPTSWLPDAPSLLVYLWCSAALLVALACSPLSTLSPSSVFHGSPFAAAHDVGPSHKCPRLSFLWKPRARVICAGLAPTLMRCCCRIRPCPSGCLAR